MLARAIEPNSIADLQSLMRSTTDIARLNGSHYTSQLRHGVVADVNDLSSDQLFIEVAGEAILLEVHELHGPAPVLEGGAERPLKASHPFWRAVFLWSRQRKRLSGTKAIWNEPGKPTLRLIRGRERA